MKAIIATNCLGFIGLNGGLPWRSGADFKHFKAITEASTLLVGYSTHLTLPPLKGRHIILDDKYETNLKGIDWCIGGKKTYEKYAEFFKELHISHINDNTIGDTLFPDFRKLNPDCVVYNYFFEVNA
jgi:dihydrofolate reductase